MVNTTPSFTETLAARVCAGVGGVFSVGVSCVRVTC